jgi:PadR family transcriptional regulator PadR
LNDINLGEIYTTLSGLEQKGLVVSEMGESAAKRGGRAKNISTSQLLVKVL